MLALTGSLIAAGVAPPGAAKFTLIINWVTWIATSICGVAFIVIGVMLGVAIHRGESGQHLARLGSAAAGVVLIGVSSQIVNALL